MSFSDDMSAIVTKIEALKAAYPGVIIHFSTYETGSGTEYLVRYKVPESPVSLDASGTVTAVCDSLQDVIDLA